MTTPKTDIQIKDQLCESIGKIEPNILLLQQSTQNLSEQVCLFKTLSQEVQEHLNSSIKKASHEIAEILVKDFTAAAGKQIDDITLPLDRSVQYALRGFQNINRRKRNWLIGFFILSCTLSGLIGFGQGYTSCLKNNSMIFMDEIHRKS